MSLLTMEGISKSFPGVTALDGVNFSLEAGEIRALVGENGAGKSTLMKILFGIYQPDAGRILVEGKPPEINSEAQAQALGIGLVSQEPQVVPGLSIAENVCLGRFPRKGLVVDFKGMAAEAERALTGLGLKRSMNTPVGELSLAERHLVQVGRALFRASRILIFDEPTASLTPKETDSLFAVIRGLKQQGMGIIFISHHLEEVFHLADTVTVLKDGQLVETRPVAGLDRQGLVRLMVGRAVGMEYPGPVTDPGTDLLRVENLTRTGSFEGVTFTLRAGEILGLAGLVGAGRTEIARAIMGADPADSGSIFIKGQQVEMLHPSQAVRHGIAYVPEDRMKQGLVLPLTVGRNISLTAQSRFAKAGVIDKQAERSAIQVLVDRLRVKTPGLDQIVRNLSGGNQQKVVFARWLLEEIDVFLLDEPTRGVDVGAKEEIYHLMRELTGEGKAVLLISSELPEVLGMSDRVLVMSYGRQVGVLSRHEATEERVMQLATGVSA